MKKTIVIVMFILGMSIAASTQVTTASNTQNTINDYVGWNAAGTTTIPVSFQHNANIGTLSRFEWYTHNGTAVGERMRLTDIGFLGLNTVAPAARYHQHQGDFLVFGLTTQPGTATVPLAANTLGDRMMWIESRGAFRAGGVNNANSDAWDAGNIGPNSAALGLNCEATGTSSMAFGGACTASGANAIAIGSGSTASNNTSIAIGTTCIATLAGDVAIGNTNNVNGGNSYAFGQNNTITSASAYSIGFANTLANVFSGALGYTINLSGSGSYGLGCFITGTGNNTVTIGNGISAANPLANGIANTMMVGFSSNYPTLLVTGGTGTVGTFGNVGIGLDASTAALTPSERLDVNGNGRFRNIPVTTPGCVLLGENVTGGGGLMDNRITRLDLNGNTGDYLAGNGTWQAIGCDWNVVNSGNDLAMGYTTGTPTACVPGNVGIGAQPLSWPRLDVFKSVTSATGLEAAQAIRFTGGTGDNYGLHGVANGATGSTLTRGIQMSASNGDEVIGGYFDASGETAGGTLTSVGVAGIARNYGSDKVTVGVFGRASNMDCNNNRTYGVYAQARAATDFSTSCTNNTNCLALTWFGNSAGTTTPVIISDESLKIDIADIGSAMEIVNQLHPKTYYFSEEAQLTLGVDGGLQYGLLAQDVEEILPGLVGTIPAPLEMDEAGHFITSDITYKGIKYGEIIPIALAAIQELSAKITTLESELDECCLLGELRSFEQPSSEHQLNITLENGDKALLGYATPNPNDGNVNINIYLPQNITGVVEVLFTDALGQPVQIAEVSERGNVQLNINTVGLSSGTYQYTLIIDGNVEATRKMIRK